MINKGLKVAVTTTTGLASLQFSELGATTIHAWSGIRDGRLTNEALAQQILNDDAELETKQRIQNTDVLFIDEIGMLSKVTFLLESAF